MGNTSDFNPFGIMCSGNPCVFDSYKQAIDTAAKTISEEMLTRNLEDPAISLTLPKCIVKVIIKNGRIH